MQVTLHYEAIVMQVTLHDKRIVMQVTLHYEAIVMQVTLHDKRIVMQVTLHYEAIVMQVTLRNKIIVMQVMLHYEAIVMQVTLHDKRIVMQVTLHYEAIEMQVTLHDKRIVMQVTLHYEAIVMQVTLHDKRIVMQVTLLYEAIAMQITLHDEFKNFPREKVVILLACSIPIGWAYAFHQDKASLKTFDDELGYLLWLFPEMIIPIIDLIRDEDPSDEVRDTEVLVSLGEISLEGKKSWESDIGDCNNTGDGGKTDGRAIITWGGEITLYAFMASIYESSCKSEKINISKRYLVKSLRELFLGALKILLEHRIAAIKGYRGKSGG
nr:hypothetical protein [Tanacetum cinerariifolium]